MDLQVQTGPFAFRQSTPAERCGGLDLQRRLVVTEPGVAVDAVERRLRRRDDFRCEPGKVVRQPLDDRNHWLPYMGLVAVPARLEPFPIIVPLQCPEEAQRLDTEHHSIIAAVAIMNA